MDNFGEKHVLRACSRERYSYVIPLFFILLHIGCFSNENTLFNYLLSFLMDVALFLIGVSHNRSWPWASLVSPRTIRPC